jgi:hypothetical protein
LGNRLSINFAAFSELNLLAARKLALVIEQDLVLGTFDQTLAKYTGKECRSSLPRMNFTELFEYWIKNNKQKERILLLTPDLALVLRPLVKNRVLVTF